MGDPWRVEPGDSELSADCTELPSVACAGEAAQPDHERDSGSVQCGLEPPGRRVCLASRAMNDIGQREGAAKATYLWIARVAPHDCDCQPTKG